YFKFAASGGSNFLVLLSTNGLRVDDYLKGLVPSVFLPLPDREHLVEEASRLSADFGLNRPDLEQLVSAMSGLFLKEIARGVTLWQQGYYGKSSDISSSLRQYKIGKFRELGLTFKEPSILGEFGGLDLLRNALEDVKFQFSGMARSFSIPLPKGWLLVGPPGTGKTFAASVCSSKLGVPLVSVDVGALIAGGAAYLSCVLQRVEAIGASVLYFDELDKLFSSNSSSLSGESGNSIQILGQLHFCNCYSQSPRGATPGANPFRPI
ncbi:AAA family ATPase, partial [Microcoleus sp. PH2017_26_ELK_O_A]|uniref:AAA family ATPase n=1 Tax=Microcoleus sp. PH2017_26_ELK_O_A TaxID=2798836 RepID=UPI001DCBC51A